MFRASSRIASQFPDSGRTIAARSALEPRVIKLERRNAQLATRVEQLEAEHLEFRRRLELLEDRRSSRAALSRGDGALLSRLFPAIAGALGSAPFTTREIVQHRAPALRLVVGDTSATALGQLFARAVGETIAGYTVQRLAREGHRVVWVIAGVCEVREGRTSTTF